MNRHSGHILRLCMLLTLTPLLVLTACSSRDRADKLYEEGKLFFKHGKYYKAIEKLEDAREARPADAPVHVPTLSLLADAYLNTDKPEVAIEIAEDVIALRGEDEPIDAFAGVYLTLGRAYMAQAGQNATLSDQGETELDSAALEKAAEIIDRLRAENPDGVEGLLLQAQLDYMNRRTDAAERLYRKALEIEPGNAFANLGLIDLLLIRGELDEAEERSRLLLDEDNPLRPRAVSKVAQVLLRRKEFDEAYKLLEPYIGPENTEPILMHHLVAGQVLLYHLVELERAGDATTTATLARMASADEPEALEGEAGEGRMSEQTRQVPRGEVVERLVNLGKVMKGRYPTIPQSFFFRGVSYQMQEDTEEAIRHYERAVSIAPGSRRMRMALVMALMREDQYPEARQQLRVLLRDYPRDREARTRLAQCLTLEGSPDEALPELRALQAEDPGDERVRRILAKTLTLSEDPENVEQGLQMMADMVGPLSTENENMIRAETQLRTGRQMMRRGELQEANDRLTEAEQLYEQTLRENPDNHAARLRLAELGMQRRDYFTAFRHIVRLAEIEPNYRGMKARMYWLLGQYGNAAREYQELVAERPEAIGHRLTLARVYEQRDQRSRTREMLEQLIEEHPGDARAYIEMARLLSSEDGAVQAPIEFLQEHRARFPDHKSYHLVLARLLNRAGRANEAVPIYQNQAEGALEEMLVARAQGAPEASLQEMRNRLAPIYAEWAAAALLAEQPAVAIEAARQGRDLETPLDGQLAALQAIAQATDGQTREALDTIQSIERSNMTGMPLIVALLVAAHGDLDQARTLLAGDEDGARGLDRVPSGQLRLYRRMLETQPPDLLKSTAPRLAFQVYVGARPLLARPATRLAEALLQQMPDEPVVLIRKAEALLLQGELDAALSDYRRVEELMPEFVQAIMVQSDVRIGLAKRAARQGLGDDASAEREEAEKLLQRCLKLAPENPDALGKLAAMKQDEGALEEANELYRQLLEVSADDDQRRWLVANNLAYNLAEQGELDEAARYAGMALEIAPQNGGLLDTVGWIELKRGNVAEALEKLKVASRRLPNHPEVRHHLAEAYLANGDVDLAIEEWRGITLATPEYERIDEVRASLMEHAASEAATPAARAVDAATTPAE